MPRTVVNETGGTKAGGQKMNKIGVQRRGPQHYEIGHAKDLRAVRKKSDGENTKGNP